MPCRRAHRRGRRAADRDARSATRQQWPASHRGICQQHQTTTRSPHLHPSASSASAPSLPPSVGWLDADLEFPSSPIDFTTSFRRLDNPNCIFFRAQWTSNVPFPSGSLGSYQSPAKKHYNLSDRSNICIGFYLLLKSSANSQNNPVLSSYELPFGSPMVPAQYGIDDRSIMIACIPYYPSRRVQKIIPKRKETRCILSNALDAVTVRSCLALAN